MARPPRDGEGDREAGNGKKEREPEGALGRRRFLQLAGLSSGLAGLDLVACSPGEGTTLDDVGEAGEPLVVDFSVNVMRPRDFVVLRFDFVKLALNAAGTAIVPKGSGTRLIVVTHAAQHVYEQAFMESSGQPVTKPVAVRLAGPSRLVFKIPATFTSVPYTVPGLLGLISTLQMRVSINAPPRTPPPLVTRVTINGSSLTSFNSKFTSSSSAITQRVRLTRGDQELAAAIDVPTAEEPSVTGVSTSPTAIINVSPTIPVQPTDTETSIELPYRLLISPNGQGAWAHSPTEVDHNGRVELWHSRLGVRLADGTIDEKNASLRTIRALWTRDSGFNPADEQDISTPNDLPFGPLQGSHRIQIVHNTSNFAPATVNYKPDPVDVNRLMLTSMGAWFDAHGNWKIPAGSLESWDNRTTHGRDHYVRIVLSGYLFPWGHKASLVIVTERKFIKNALGQGDEHVAFLWTRFFVIVREPLKTWSNSAPLRKAPFLKIGVKQLVSPDLTATTDELLAAGDGSAPLLLKISGTEPYRFPFEVVDRTGRISRFNGAAVWVMSFTGQGTPPPSNVEAPLRALARTAFAPHAVTSIGGQRVAFADPDRVDDTTYETDSIEFEDIDDGTGGAAPGFTAGLKSTSIRVEAIRQLSGNAAASSFNYADQYLANGFLAGNTGHLLFKVAGGGVVPLSFKKKSDQTGGFIAPSMDISGLSRKAGPVAGPLAKLAANTVSPAELFSSIDALLFGVFKLSDILTALGGLNEAPKFITQGLDVVEDFLAMIEKAKQVSADFQAAAALPGELSLAITDALAAIDATLAAGLTLDVSQMLVHIGELDTALASAETSVSTLAPTVASGLKVQFTKLIGQIRDVISTNLEPPLQAFATAQELAKSQIVRLDWRPPIKGFAGIFEPKNPRGLLLAVEARAKDLPGKPAGVDLIASIEDFNLNLIGSARFMVLSFQRIQFKVTTGKKPEIDVVLDDLIFDGVLAFVQKLRELIPLEGFSDPPNVSVSTEGIEAGFTLPIPGVAVGMFSLDNLSLSAGFKIPFVGPPVSVNFSFCKRESPFVLTVCMIGGGGFFGITVSPNGVEILEASLEAGAALAVDFGVASGSISIMLGIYFKMEAGSASLTGYLRMRGEVDVLGIISASIELRMELTYEFSSHKCVGKASIEIEVSVFCFSGTVTIEAERKFSGSNEDPTLQEMMAPSGTYQPWREYVLAFAA